MNPNGKACSKRTTTRIGHHSVSSEALSELGGGFKTSAQCYDVGWGRRRPELGVARSNPPSSKSSLLSPAQLLLQVHHVLVTLSIVVGLRLHKLVETAKMIHLEGEGP